MDRLVRLRRALPLLVIGLLVLGAMGALTWFIVGAMNAPKTEAKKVVQQVNIIRPPPPPPEVDEPPPPPEVDDEVEVPEPEEPMDQPDLGEPPPGDLLGLDAEGVAGGDAFGLLARKGGRDLLSLSGGRHDWYKNSLNSELADPLLKEITDYLENNQPGRSRSFSVVIRLWLSKDGRVERYQVESTGDQTIDTAVQTALARLDRVPEPPPADLPQPVKLRFVHRT